MSIATEITRLQNAKASIKTSIENKGVTVPSATKLDGYSALIDAIPSGGGGSSLDDYMSNVDIAINSNITYLKPEGITSNNITEIVLPECVEFAHNAIAPAVVYLNGGTLNFTKLTKISLPKLAICQGRIINGVQGNTDINLALVLPSLSQWATASNARHFDNSSRITKYDFGNPSITSFNWGAGSAFYRCYNVTDIILRWGGVPTIANTNVFRKDNSNNLPLGTTTFVYVPSSLLSAYQTATNWSTIYASYPDMFKTIEGSIYETHYADGTPIS